MEIKDEDRIKFRDELILQKDRKAKVNEDLEAENKRLKNKMETYL